MNFTDLDLSPEILQAIEEKGYTQPSPIQEKAIPVVLEGHDLMAAAQTGTGKTAGFTLPLLERLSKGERARPNQVRALVLTPTRELAAQVGENVSEYSTHLPLSSAIVYGGVKINPQMMRMRRGADVLVATPGRLLDLYQQKAIRFKQLEVLVLDEADRMLDMGFIHDIRKIINILPKERQNLLFSATFSDQIRDLARSIVRDPVEVSVTPPNSTARKVKQWICPLDKKQKPAVLTALIKEYDWQQVLVFTRTKHGANRLTKQLESKKITASAIHGNKSQGARVRALNEFKEGKIRVLVATDIAARGLDIDQLPQVVNFDLPNVAEDYVHRIGRTGRAGASGEAISLVCADEFDQLKAIENLIQKILPREEQPGFEPVHNLPLSSLNPKGAKKKIKRPKKPKAAKSEHQDGQRSGDTARGHKPTGKNRKHVAKPSGGANKNRAPSKGKPSSSKANSTAKSQGNKAQGSGNKPALTARKPRRRPVQK